MEKNDRHFLNLGVKNFMLYILGISMSVVLSLSSVKDFFEKEHISVGAYIILLLIIYNYCISANFKSNNSLFWILLSVQVFVALVINLQGLAGALLIIVYNSLNVFSVKWYGRKLKLISTQSIQDTIHERGSHKLGVLDFAQIPIIILIFYAAYVLSDKVLRDFILDLPLLH